MGSARKWPEGVPPLPRKTTGPVYETLHLHVGYEQRWRRVSMSNYKTRPFEFDNRDYPKIAQVIRLRGTTTVIDANAAARALGIVPDAEQEPDHE